MSRYRVWWVPQIPCASFEVNTSSLAVARALVDVLAEYDLFQYKHGIKPDYSNTGGIAVWDRNTNDWEDVDEDDPEADVVAWVTP